MVLHCFTTYSAAFTNITSRNDSEERERERICSVRNPDTLAKIFYNHLQTGNWRSVIGFGGQTTLHLPPFTFLPASGGIGRFIAAIGTFKNQNPNQPSALLQLHSGDMPPGNLLSIQRKTAANKSNFTAWEVAPFAQAPFQCLACPSLTPLGCRPVRCSRLLVEIRTQAYQFLDEVTMRPPVPTAAVRRQQVDSLIQNVTLTLSGRPPRRILTRMCVIWTWSGWLLCDT